jgi:hypothetical protein
VSNLAADGEFIKRLALLPSAKVDRWQREV